MNSYALAHAVAVVNAIALGVCGVITAAYLTPMHPEWLTADVAATSTLLAGCLGVVAVFLPRVQRTPAKREQNYLKAARVGVLPTDLAKKHPTLGLPPLGVLDDLPPAT